MNSAETIDRTHRRVFEPFRRGLIGLVATMSLLVSAGAAGAADKAGKFAVKGAGVAPCSVYVAARGKNPAQTAVFRGWVNGYLTAINRFENSTYDVVSWQATPVLMALLESHCKKNPDQRFYLAVAALANTLKPDRLQGHSQTVTLQSGDAKVRIYRIVLLRAQKALQQRGHYGGKLDGSYGPNTQRAFEAFQQAENLKVTGLPDQATLFRLLK